MWSSIPTYQKWEKIRLKMDEDKMDEDISMMKTIPGL